jgi:hypothetical protein
VQAQIQVGDDLRMNMGGLLTAGYSGNYGNQIPSTHGLDFGANAQLSGSYYDPNFLNFSFTPYYNQSRADSSFQSLTDSSGLDATANFFTGSHFPGFLDYHYTHNSTGTFGLVGSPSFTTVGNGQGFAIGWSALLRDWPTLSASYSQGSGSGTVFGTNQESGSSTKTFNLRSSYHLLDWNLNAFYTHLDTSTRIPYFLGGQEGNDLTESSGNSYGINGSRPLPWKGSVALSFTHNTYSGNFNTLLSENTSVSDYTTNLETAVVSFHPTNKLGLFVDQNYTDNLNGYLYQNIVNSGGGVPVVQSNSESNSSTLSAGANYLFLPSLYGQAQITYFNQQYLGKSYDGSYLTGTVGYSKRILKTFLVSATVIESSNQFANNSLGFIVDVNGFRRFGLWETSGAFSYAQNVQTLLVTYTTSYYNYSGNVHRRLGRGMQWTGAFNGTHSGLTNYAGTTSHSEGFSTSLALRRMSLTGNYIQSNGQSLLTSTGIQPIPPTPGLPPEGIIVYNGKSYGGAITITPVPRLTITGSYSHASSDTLSSSVLSNNRTEIFYSQLQYRLRQLNVLAGYTKFSQGISAAGTPPGNEYSYFIGVSRWINFF